MKNIILEKSDFEYLKGILKVSGYENNLETRNSLKKLASELDTAQVLKKEDFPKNVIGFNSHAVIKIDDKQTVKVQLVKPANKNWQEGKISILTPMGLALIGYKEGDTVKWQFPKGKKSIKILSVKQANAVKKSVSVT